MPVRGQVPVQERALEPRLSVEGDAGVGRGARTSSGWGSSTLPLMFIRPGGWPRPRQGPQSRADSCNPSRVSWATSLGPRPEWGAGGRWARPSLCSPSFCSAHPLPPAGHCESGLLTQLAAPWPPQPVPHHLQPGSARNSLGCFQAPAGSRPGLCPGHQGPASGPAEAPRWGLEKGQQG